VLWATDFRRPFGPESRASKADSDLADESHRSTEGPNYERICTEGSVVGCEQRRLGGASSGMGPSWEVPRIRIRGDEVVPGPMRASSGWWRFGPAPPRALLTSGPVFPNRLTNLPAGEQVERERESPPATAVTVGRPAPAHDPGAT